MEGSIIEEEKWFLPNMRLGLICGCAKSYKILRMASIPAIENIVGEIRETENVFRKVMGFTTDTLDVIKDVEKDEKDEKDLKFTSKK
jgi:hypothetical protein